LHYSSFPLFLYFVYYVLLSPIVLWKHREKLHCIGGLMASVVMTGAIFFKFEYCINTCTISISRYCYCVNEQFTKHLKLMVKTRIHCITSSQVKCFLSACVHHLFVMEFGHCWYMKSVFCNIFQIWILYTYMYYIHI
jgi:hypothetical protein